jgi:hypothetical protein
VKFWLGEDPEFGVAETAVTFAFEVVKDHTVELLVPVEFFAITFQ